MRFEVLTATAIDIKVFLGDAVKYGNLFTGKDISKEPTDSTPRAAYLPDRTADSQT